MKRAMLALAAFGVSAGAMRGDTLDAAAGKALFDRLWVPAPATTNAADGLGPLFNGRGCVSCHPKGDGARVVQREDEREDIDGAVVRFGAKDGSTDPAFGQQLQTDAVPGMAPEGRARFLPKLSFELEVGTLAPGVNAGARLAPPLFDVAAFDSVPDEEILKRADPYDKDGDGVSGRANILPEGGIGRFGWKAAQPTLANQIAHALNLDLGLSSPLAPRPYGDCTAKQPACLAAPNGESAAFDGREVSNQMIDLMAAYVATLKAAPPPDDPAGAALFDGTGCAACHAPQLTTKTGNKIPAFTDLLLHDMGPDLDDGVGEPGIASSEWRTAPLKKSNPRGSARRYLHDGSAASVEGAVGKHGGEGSRARAAFDKLGADDRRRLINYVMGL